MKYQILLKQEYQFNETTTRLFTKTLSNFKRGFITKLQQPFPYEFLIDCDKGGTINFYFSGDIKAGIKDSLSSLFQSEAEIYEVLDVEEKYKTVNTLHTNANKTLSLFVNDKVFNFILAQMKPYSRIRMQFDVTKEKAIADKATSLLRADRVESVIECLITVEARTKYDRAIAHRIAHDISDLTGGDRKLWVKNWQGFYPTRITTSEFLNLFQFPTLYRRDDELAKRISKLADGQSSLRETEFSSGIRVGILLHPMVKNRSVYLDPVKLREHVFVSGKTGSGKSSFVEEIIRDILHKKAESKKNVPGFTFFDPAETSVLGVIDYIRKLKADGYDMSEVEKIIHYIDLSPNTISDCTFPINLLCKDIDSTRLLAFFKELFGDSPTPRLDRILMNAIGALLLDTEDHTITDIPKLLKNEEYRSDVLIRLKSNPYARSQYEFFQAETLKPAEIEPVLNRLDPFLNTISKQRMFGTTGNSLQDIRKWMDEGHIVLVNMQGMSDYDMKIIIGYMAVQYYVSASKRPDFGLIHFMIIDEAHKVQLTILENIIAELRKKGLALMPVTQFLEQFNPDYLKAILGNIGTIVSFKQGDSAAKQIEIATNKKINRTTLQGLSRFTGAIHTEDNDQDKSIIVKVEPPYRYTDGKMVDYKKPANVEANVSSNRQYALALMKRDYVSNKTIDHKIFKMQKEFTVAYEED